MKSFYARGTVFLISVVGYAELAHAQTPSLRTPSLFPTPAIEHPIQNLSGGARPIANGHYSAVRTTSGYGWHAQDPPPAPSDLQPSPQVPDVPPNPLPAPKLSAPKPQPSPSSAAGAGNSGWIHGAANGYYDGYPCNDGYDYCDQSGGGIGGRFGCWFASGSGLFMQRDNAENVWTSFDTNNIASRILSSRSAEMDWAGGFETHIGRYFHEGRHALEGVYWGIFPNDEEANAYGADMVGQLSTTFSFNSLEYNDGGGAGAAVGWFDGAQRHRVRRTFEFHNAEINVLGSPDCLVFGGGDSCGCGPESCGARPMLMIGWLAGFRYFKFDETFLFSADEGDTIFTGAADELHYVIDVDNNLFGGQLGCNGDLQVSDRFRLFADTKFGVYGNHISHVSAIYGGAGAVTVNDPTNPFNTQAFNIRSNTNHVAFLGEMKLGGSFNVRQNLRLFGGYRAVAATGVALSTHQIPANFGDFEGVANIDSDGSLILHGAFGGVEFNY